MSMLDKKIVTVEVIKFNAAQNILIADKKFISIEKFFELRLNGKFYKKIFCSPNDIEDLTVGILAQAEKIFSVEDIMRLEIKNSLIEVETAEVVNAPEVKGNFSNEVRFIAKDILKYADKLLGAFSLTHDKTKGVHSGILFDGREILLFREDIGRHNVFDKIYGAALREKIFLGDKALIFSGRCSSEMMIKLCRMKIPVIVAKSVPTTFSINLAKKFGITLAGCMTADSFCIYTNSERILLS